MRRTTTKKSDDKKLPDRNALAVEALQTFISYFEKISEQNGDGMIRIAGKQASVLDFERFHAENSNAQLRSERDQTIEFNFADLYDPTKAGALYGNKYISAAPSASIQCRAKPEEMTKAYGIDFSQFNYRQLILLNNVLFETGMHFMQKYGIVHDQLTPVFQHAFKGIDFNMLGMKLAGDNQPGPDLLPALQNRVTAITEMMAKLSVDDAPLVRSSSAPTRSPAASANPEHKRRFSLFAKKSVSEIDLLKAEIKKLSDGMERILHKEGGANVAEMMQFKQMGKDLTEKQRQLAKLQPQQESPRPDKK